MCLKQHVRHSGCWRASVWPAFLEGCSLLGMTLVAKQPQNPKPNDSDPTFLPVYFVPCSPEQLAASPAHRAAGRCNGIGPLRFWAWRGFTRGLDGMRCEGWSSGQKHQPASACSQRPPPPPPKSARIQGLKVPHLNGSTAKARNSQKGVKLKNPAHTGHNPLGRV